jgi:hypothetical protein
MPISHAAHATASTPGGRDMMAVIRDNDGFVARCGGTVLSW